MIPLAALLAAGTLPAVAVRVPVHEDPAAVFVRSRREPEVLHALIVSATWCVPCKRLKEQLASYQSSTGAVASAAWSLVDIDRMPSGAVGAFLAEQGAVLSDSLPSVMALRAGRPLGHSTAGADLSRVERFLSDATTRRTSAEARSPRLVCPGTRDTATFTLGVSGYMSEEDRGTDWFGRGILLAFRDKPHGTPARLLAPPMTSSTTLIAAESGEGVFYADDATLPFLSLYAPVEEAPGAVEELARAPGSRLRLILTGHGGPAGMAVGYEAVTFEDGSAPLPFKKETHLDEPALTRGIQAARKAGKEVRGLVTSCYGGQFAPAFMPLRGAAAACAAFSTVPDKTAEGCYPNSAAARHDYVASLARVMSCPAAPGGSRVRHYRSVAVSEGRDVPMLTSEYFLLYGSAAEFLGRQARLPAPQEGLALKRFEDGVEVVFDLVGGGVIAARRDGKPLPLPRLSILGCRVDGISSIDSPNFFYLRAHGVGPKSHKNAACVPEVGLDWDEEEDVQAPSRRTVLLETGVLGDEKLARYEPASGSQWDRQRSAEVAAVAGSATVDARGLRPEARVWLATGWPRLARPLSGAALERTLEDLATEVRPLDADLAQALSALTARARERARARAPSEEGFSAAALARAMAENLGAKERFDSDVLSARLAHLVAVAAAELALRAQTKTSKKAQELTAQLDALKACERTVLD